MGAALPNENTADRAAAAAEVARSLAKVEEWVVRHDYQGYEPSDGNLSVLHPLTFSRPLLERVLQQLVWKAPLNLRPLLGVRPHRATKAMGYMAAGYIADFRRTGSSPSRGHAVMCLDWLMQNKAPMYPQYCWGDHFAFSSRGGRRPPHEPTVVWTGLIGQTFMEAHEAFGDPRHMDVAASACEWVAALPRNETDRGLCLGYTALGRSTIHNSNMLGAALLARASRCFGRPDYAALAREAVRYTCERQAADGSWTYGDEPKYAWIDNFHTGYNLDALRCYQENTGDATFARHLDRGLTYYARTFFEVDGRPKYYHDRTYPIDIQCASQSIETLTLFADRAPELLELAMKVAAWTIANMQDADGHFHYRHLGWRRVRTPMFHWGQATMFKALEVLLAALDGRAHG